MGYEDNDVKEIVIENRIKLLLDSFHYPKAAGSKENALKFLRKSYCYQDYNKELEEKIVTKVDLLDSDINMNLSYYEEEDSQTSPMYLKVTLSSLMIKTKHIISILTKSLLQQPLKITSVNSGS